jgi:hypothetical protein
MRLSYILALLILTFSTQTLADRENDMWQQFKAQKGMKELDAEFDEPKSQPEPKVIEKVIERVIIQQVAVPVAAPAQPQPEPVAVAQPAPVTPAPAQPSDVTVESDGYVFKLGSCELAHRNIKCKLTITSVGRDGDLTLLGTYGNRSSKLFDHNGNEYHPSSISMGNKSGTGRSSRIKNKYISDVTAKGGIEFANVDASTNSIALVELSIRNLATRKWNRIKFRGVSLSL